MKSSGLGGMAVVDGIMIKSNSSVAIAVKDNKNEIKVNTFEYNTASDKELGSIPFLRGILIFFEWIVLALRGLGKSADLYDENHGSKKNIILDILLTILSIVVFAALFIFVPALIADMTRGFIHNTPYRFLLEGLLRIVIFIIALIFVSMNKDVKNSFMYQAALHMSINCVEKGKKLGVDNVKKMSWDYKTSEVSFIISSFFLSFILFMFVNPHDLLLRFCFRILLLIVFSGIYYELILLGSRKKSMRFLLIPTLWIQKMITSAPSDAAINVAIEALDAVFDWRTFYEKRRKVALRRKKIEELRKKAREEEEKILSEGFEADGEASAEGIKAAAIVSEEDLATNKKEKAKTISSFEELEPEVASKAKKSRRSKKGSALKNEDNAINEKKITLKDEGTKKKKKGFAIQPKSDFINDIKSDINDVESDAVETVEPKPITKNKVVMEDEKSEVKAEIKAKPKVEKKTEVPESKVEKKTEVSEPKVEKKTEIPESKAEKKTEIPESKAEVKVEDKISDEKPEVKESKVVKPIKDDDSSAKEEVKETKTVLPKSSPVEEDDIKTVVPMSDATVDEEDTAIEDKTPKRNTFKPEIVHEKKPKKTKKVGFFKRDKEAIKRREELRRQHEAEREARRKERERFIQEVESMDDFNEWLNNLDDDLDDKKE